MWRWQHGWTFQHLWMNRVGLIGAEFLMSAMMIYKRGPMRIARQLLAIHGNFRTNNFRYWWFENYISCESSQKVTKWIHRGPVIRPDRITGPPPVQLDIRPTSLSGHFDRITRTTGPNLYVLVNQPRITSIPWSKHHVLVIRSKSKVSGQNERFTITFWA